MKDTEVAQGQRPVRRRVAKHATERPDPPRGGPGPPRNPPASRATTPAASNARARLPVSPGPAPASAPATRAPSVQPGANRQNGQRLAGQPHARRLGRRAPDATPSAARRLSCSLHPAVHSHDELLLARRQRLLGLRSASARHQSACRSRTRRRLAGLRQPLARRTAAPSPAAGSAPRPPAARRRAPATCRPARSAGRAPSPASIPSPATDRLGRLQRQAAGEDRQPPEELAARPPPAGRSSSRSSPATSAGAAGPSGCRPVSSRKRSSSRAAICSTGRARTRRPPARAPAGCRPAGGRPRPPPPRSRPSSAKRGAPPAPGRRRAPPPGRAPGRREPRRLPQRLGHRKRRHPPGDLAGHPERLAAGGQHRQARARAQERLDQTRHRLDEVLGIVDDHQRPTGHQCRHQHLQRRAAGGARPDRRPRPRPAAPASGRSAGRRSTQATSPGKDGATARAAAMATRVLPTPPLPVRVSRRVVPSNATTRATSRSRPMRRV